MHEQVGETALLSSTICHDDVCSTQDDDVYSTQDDDVYSTQDDDVYSTQDDDVYSTQDCPGAQCIITDILIKNIIRMLSVHNFIVYEIIFPWP